MIMINNKSIIFISRISITIITQKPIFITYSIKFLTHHTVIMSLQIVMGLDATELPDYTCIIDNNDVKYMTLYGAWVREDQLSEEVRAHKYSPKFQKQMRNDMENDCFRQKYDTPEPRGRGRPRKNKDER